MTRDRGWRRRFEEPIPLARGRHLVTLEDAGRYITNLAKAEHKAAEWQAGDGGIDPGRGTQRSDDDGANWRYEDLEPSRRAGV